MTRGSRAVLAIIVAAGVCAPALAQPKDSDKKPASPAASAPAAPAAAQPDKKGPGDMKMPSPEDMKKMQEMMAAYEDFGKSGPQHDFLKKAAGTWHGKVKSYEMPGQPAQESECDETVKSILGGKFTTCEVSGEMGSMGHFEGFGLYGYDNAQKKFTMAWADNMGTCIMNGTGELSADQKTLTWTMNFVDPYTHKASSMREVDTFLGDDETRMEMYGENPFDPAHKEMKMLEINFKRTGKGAEKAAEPKTDKGAEKPKTAK
jgi:hypothetical protein